VHTHASENRDEIALVAARTGRRNLQYFHDLGLASPRLCVAHCVWVDEAEQALLAEREVKVSHCPGSNLKLGSGIAPVVDMRARNISVSLGADGAACNNQLDMFAEMRLAATLQAVARGPGALPARDVLWMATREGARALGLEREIGAIEIGKRADFIIVDRSGAHLASAPDPFSALVYSGRPSDVSMTVVDGEIVVEDHQLVHHDQLEIATAARHEAAALAKRAF
jgi:5-methylthioadenosine/S-adenosylhomocysteine deaminase